MVYCTFRNYEDFYFTGKRKEIFCERLQMVIGEIQKNRQRHNTLPSIGTSGYGKAIYIAL